jgi:V8-like Glu-specific endopeptidase
MPPDCPAIFAKWCWDGNPEKRPDINSILKDLREFQRSLSPSSNSGPKSPSKDRPSLIDEPQLKTMSSKPISTLRAMSTKMVFDKTLTARLEGSGNRKPKVITNDGRKMVEKTFEFPASVHGVVRIDTGDGKTEQWGTGILIGPNMVLTAAHNLYSASELPKKKFPKFTFIAGASGKDAPFE